jgi:hypothetical protein
MGDINELSSKIYNEMKRFCKNLNTDVYTKKEENDRERIQRIIPEGIDEEGEDSSTPTLH